VKGDNVTDDRIYELTLAGAERLGALALFVADNPEFRVLVERLLKGDECCLTCRKAFPDMNDDAYEDPGGYVLLDPGGGRGRGYVVCRFCWQAEDEELWSDVLKALTEIEPETKIRLAPTQ
jgi:hypothetical protein